MSKRIKMSSPKGTAVWPHLNTPDKRFDDRGVYGVTLRVTDENGDATTFITALKKVFKEGYDAHKATLKKKQLKVAMMPWGAEDDDTGEPTGNLLFKFKTYAEYQYEGRTITNRIQLIDAKMNPVTAQVGGGSIIRVGFEPYVWHVPSMGVGMTLRLKMAQVLELVEYGGDNDVAEFGFTEEDGFVGVETESKESGTTADDFDF